MVVIALGSDHINEIIEREFLLDHNEKTKNKY